MTCCTPRLLLGTTESVCPVCLKTIPAERIAEGDTVFLCKTCPDHGAFRAPIWRGLDSWYAWGRGARAFSRPPVTATPVARGCPQDCGLCPDHRQQSCCVLLEVTSRCDLACPICFASAGPHGRDATLAEIDGWLDTLAEAGGRVHVQLSGGEPTVRDDLPEIVARIRARGFDFVQLNTNGIRLALDPDYLDALVVAGLDCVFLQFDGIDDGVHRAIRGARLAKLKEKAIERCGDAGVGVVLVPTVVPGINDGAIGAVVDYAVARMPVVRAVHFQPVSWFGRFPDPTADHPRITLPEIVEALVVHSGGTLHRDDFRPGTAENPYCSFSGRFRVDAAGRLHPHGAAASCCGTPPADAPLATETDCCGGPTATETDCCGGPTATAGTGCCGSTTTAAAPTPATAGCGCGAPVEETAAPADCCGSARPSRDVDRARRTVAGQWRRSRTDADGRPSPSLADTTALGPLDAFDRFLAEQDRVLGLSGMAFQDAWTLDLDRLRQCHIHVVAPDRRVVPFCAWNLTDAEGRPLHRPAPATADAGR